MADRIRVALCDDHGVVRSGLRLILAAEPDMDVIGDVATADDAVAMAREARPDVFVMDLGIAEPGGLVATRQVVQASPNTAVLILTVQDDVAYLRKAFEAGAAGYLVKEAADVELVQAVRAVAAGQQYVHPTLGAALLAGKTARARPGGPGGELSTREQEVLRFIALGLTNAEIGERLFVSVRTVETHRAHIHQKLGLHTRAELVRFARDTGLLDEDP